MILESKQQSVALILFLFVRHKIIDNNNDRMMKMYLVVGLGGIIGAVLRFFISKLLLSYGNIFPFGTLTVNLIGCFILGYFQGLAKIYYFPTWLVLGFGTGLIGAFTTFSTFSLEVIQYVHLGYRFLPLIYMIVSSAGGYFFVLVGNSLSSYIKKRDDFL